MYWLSWLAEKLIKEKETEFLIERMQPDWLPNKRQKLIYSFIFDLIFALLVGFILWLSRQETINIKTVERLKIDPNPLIKSFFKYFIYGLIVVLIYGLIGWLIFGLIGGLIFALFVGLIGWLIGGQKEGLIKLEIENKTIPNQGIWSSVTNMVIIFSILCSSLALLSIIFILIVQNYFPLKWQLTWYGSLIVTSLTALFFSIHISGLPAIQHFVLRIFLWSNGYIPWNYAKFLDYATNHLFLQ